MRFAYRKEFATEPIAATLDRRGWQTIATDQPGEAVLAGHADIALTPALDYARCLGIVDYALVPGVGIMTSGFAGLIKLVFNRGLVNFETIAVRDPESSETIIAKILLAEKHDIEPRLVRAAEGATLTEMLATADAALLAADDAIFDGSGSVSLLDLTDEWDDMTESPLPYMLAWGRVQEIPEPVLEELRHARDESVLMIADLAAQHPRSAQANAFYQRYLRGDVRYALEVSDLQALDVLYRYAFYRTEISDIPSIKFLPDGEPADLPAPPK